MSESLLIIWNFVDKGICADRAIYDSENDKGQRNLHIHVLLTMRPLTENGEWGAKQKKIYDLDENGEKIPVIDKKTGQQKVDKRNRKQWKCHTADSTDWNSKENAKMWRKDLADTINATNEQLGIAVHWDSFESLAKFTADRNRNTNSWKQCIFQRGRN